MKRGKFIRTEEYKNKIRMTLLGRPLSEETKRKMSVARMGHPTSNETKKKISLSERGSKHWNWKGNESASKQLTNKRIRDNTESRLWREAVFAQDEYTCQKCGDNHGGNLNAHHIKNFADFPELRFAIDNGITLCKKCHNLFHKTYKCHNNTEEQIKEFLIKPH